MTGLVDGIDARLEEGTLEPPEALLLRTDLMRRWRSLAVADPQLPDVLLPADWPCRNSRARFESAYDALGPLAELRVLELVGHGVDPADAPHHHLVSDIAQDSPKDRRRR